VYIFFSSRVAPAKNSPARQSILTLTSCSPASSVLNNLTSKIPFSKLPLTENSQEGVPLIRPVVDDLLDNSRKTGIPFEAS
jgi:hypothetical protein